MAGLQEASLLVAGGPGSTTLTVPAVGSWEMVTELSEKPEARQRAKPFAQGKEKFLRGDDQDRCRLRMSWQPHSATWSSRSPG